MPDWVSHLIFGLIIAEFVKTEKKSLILLGSLLPDILPKTSLIFFHLGIPKIFSFSIFHTPLVASLIGILIAPLFLYNRIKASILIIIGVMGHILADLTLRGYAGGMSIFFPFSAKGYSLNLLWPEQSLYFLLACLLAYAVIKTIKRMIKLRHITKILTVGK